MDMISVNSSSISQIGYDPATSTMAVSFNSGQTYEYDGISQGTYNSIAFAPSVGKAFHAAKLSGGRKV